MSSHQHSANCTHHVGIQHKGLGSHHNHSHSAIKNLWLAFFLNLGFAILELIGGLFVNSMAILSDALHDFGDAFAILISLLLEKWSQRGASDSFTYGYRRFSPLAALITGVILSLGAVVIVLRSLQRLMSPEQPNVQGMILLALLGVLVNGYGAYKVSKGHSLNEKMITWHLLEDLAGWIVVLGGAIFMMFFDWPQMDSLLAILLSVWVLYNVLGRLKEGFAVFLQAAPAALDIPGLIKKIQAIPGVRDLHHVHTWSLDGEQHIFTCHLVVQAGVTNAEIESIKAQAKAHISSHQIAESNLEIEVDGHPCPDPTH